MAKASTGQWGHGSFYWMLMPYFEQGNLHGDSLNQFINQILAMAMGRRGRS